MKNWLILADDLTGAADCAIAFCRQGATATVGWKNAYPSLTDRAQIFSYNIDGRELNVSESVRLQHQTLEKLWSPKAFLFCKIDSTLRGQPGAVIAATSDFLKQHTGRAVGVLAPAFPATERTTRGGKIFVNNIELENTELWARDHTYPTSDLKQILHDVGLKAFVIDLETLRQDANRLSAYIENIEQQNKDFVFIFDAETPEDLQQIANAFSKADSSHFFIGSAGLAHAFAARCPARPRNAIINVKNEGGIMIVVGSLAKASRLSAKKLLDTRLLRHFPVDPDVLIEGGAGIAGFSHDVAEALRKGDDILVEITVGKNVDMSLGSRLALDLAGALQCVGNDLAGFAATGGETATYLMDALGVNGITLEDEIEAGVCLGVTRGKIVVPIATKAGAFGDENSLVKIFDRLSDIRNKGKL